MAVNSSRGSVSHRALLLAGCAAATTMPAAPVRAQGINGTFTPTPGATLVQINGTTSQVNITTPTAVLDWNSTGAQPFVPSTGTAIFQGQSGGFTVLNRFMSATSQIAIDGAVEGRLGAGGPIGGNVWFYSPTGIVAGAGSRFDVGSLILSANPFSIPSGDTISFGAPASATATVEVMNGARINALNTGSYVALVAPRVIQDGSVTVNGNAAYVAANQASITVTQGMFSIAITEGTDAADALTHRGTTLGYASTGAGDERRIYVATLAKNDVVTALVGGSIGFEAASAGILDGVVVLSGGEASAPRGTADARTNLTLTGFQSDNARIAAKFGGTATVLSTGLSDRVRIGGSLLLLADAVSVVASGTDAQIMSNRSTLVGYSGGLSLLADGTRAAITGGPLEVSTNRTALSLTADNGGALRFTQTSIETDSFSVVPGDSSAGAVTISAERGGLFSLGNTQVLTSAAGGNSFFNPGGSATGGNVTVSVGETAAASDIGSLDITTSATGGNGSNAMATDAAGKAGDVSITSTGGGLTIGNVAITANGTGGNASTGADSPGGAGTGGAVTIAYTDPNNPPTIGGEAATPVISLGNLLIDTGGFGGNAGQTAVFVGDAARVAGGAGTGGAVSIAGDAVALSSALTITTRGVGGAGGGANDFAGAGGAALGGAIVLESGTGPDLASLTLITRATGGAGGSGSGGYGDVIGGEGGSATGGSSVFRVLKGDATASDIVLTANAVGGIGGAGVDGGNGGSGGQGTGGAASMDVAGGSLSVTGTATANALGIGGVGGAASNGPSIAGFGGTGQGGQADVMVAASAEFGSIVLRASGLGGDSAGDALGDAGTGRGGLARLTVGGTATVANVLVQESSAQGGTGGGAAAGGSSEIIVGGTLRVQGAASLRSDGLATDIGPFSATTGLDATGGGIAVTVGNGGSADFVTSLSLNSTASASSGSFGQASGGARAGGVTVTANDAASLSVTGLTVAASAIAAADDIGSARAPAGAGGSGLSPSVSPSVLALGTPGDATGGDIDIVGRQGSVITIGTVTIDSGAQAGLADDGLGGAAQGGAIGIRFQDGGTDGLARLTMGATTLDTSVIGGAGIGGGGDASAGAVTLSLTRVDGVVGVLTATSTAEGGAGNSNGGNGFGGAITLVSSASTLNFAGLDLAANGTGGAMTGGFGQAGSGAGGNIELRAETGYGPIAGSLTVTGSTLIATTGAGGDTSDGYAVRGGDGTGGRVSILGRGGSVSLNDLFVSTSATGSAGSGAVDPDTSGDGGAATGGAVDISTGGSGSAVTITGTTTIDAGATGGMGGGDASEATAEAGDGGAAQGGFVGITASDSPVSLGAVSITTSATGGSGGGGERAFRAGDGGNAAAGGISLSGSFGNLITGALTLNAVGRGGNGGRTEAGYGAGSFGGRGEAGNIVLTAQSNTVSTGAIAIDARAFGGSAQGGESTDFITSGGAARGGTLTITSNGGSMMQTGAIAAQLQASGGEGFDGAGGGAAERPNADGSPDMTIGPAEGQLLIDGDLTLDGAVSGGANNGSVQGGYSSQAGSVSARTGVLGAGNGTLTVRGNTQINVSAASGISRAGAVRGATGGTAFVVTGGGTIDLAGLTIDASATTRSEEGGTGFSSGGNQLAQGGGIQIRAEQGGLIRAAGAVSLLANAQGADALSPVAFGSPGLPATGGTIVLSANDATIALSGTLAMTANGTGGAGDSAGAPVGVGTGGQAGIAVIQGGLVSLDTFALNAVGSVQPGEVIISVQDGTFSAAGGSLTGGAVPLDESRSEEAFQGDITLGGDATVDRSSTTADAFVVGEGVPVADITGLDESGYGAITFLRPGSTAVFNGNDDGVFGMLVRAQPDSSRGVALYGTISGVAGNGPGGDIAIYNAGGLEAGSGTTFSAGRVTLTTDPTFMPIGRPVTPPPPTGGAFQGIPEVASGTVTIDRTPTLDTITIGSSAAIIDWGRLDESGYGAINFLPFGNSGVFQNDPALVSNFTVLNRIIPTDTTRPIAFDGSVTSRIRDGLGGSVTGGTVWFYSPGGIILGTTATFDVGSLMLSTNAVQLNGGDLLQPDGRVQLLADADSDALLSIATGAQLIANDVGGHLILSAPRISVQGIVESGGLAALVAARGATIGLDPAAPSVDIDLAVNNSGTARLDLTGGRVADRGTGTRTILLATSAANPGGTAIDATGGMVIANAGGRIIATASGFGGRASATSDLALFGGQFDGPVTAFGDAVLVQRAGTDLVLTGDLALSATGEARIAVDDRGPFLSGNLIAVADSFALTTAAPGGTLDVLDAAITTTGAIALSDDGAVLTGRDLVLNAGGQFSGDARGATLTVQAGSVNGGDLQSQSGDLNVTAGTITLDSASADSGNATLTATDTLAVGSLYAFQTATARGTAITIGNALTNGALDVEGTGDVQIDGGNAQSARIAGTNVRLVNGFDANFGDLTVAANGSLQAGTLSAGTITLTGRAITTGTLSTAVGDISVFSPDTVALGTILSAAGAMIEAGYGLTFGDLEAAGDVRLRGADIGGGALAIGGTLDAEAAGTLALAGGTAGDTALRGDIVAMASDFASAGVLTIAGGSRIETRALRADGGLSLEAATVQVGDLRASGGVIRAIATAGTLTAEAVDMQNGTTAGVLEASDDLTVALIAATGDVAVRGAAVTVGGAAVGGLLDIQSRGSALLGGGNAGALLLASGGDAEVGGAFTTAGLLRIVADGAVRSDALTGRGGLSLDGTDLTTGALITEGGALIAVARTGTAVLGPVNAGGAFDLSAAGAIAVASLNASGGGGVTGSAVDLGTVGVSEPLQVAASGGVRLDGGTAGTAAITGDTIRFDGGFTTLGTLTATSTGDLLVTDALSGGAGLTLRAATLTTAALTSANGPLSVTTTGGAATTGALLAGTTVTLDSAGAVATGTVTSGGDTLARGSSIMLGTQAVGGTLDAQSAGAVRIAGGTARDAAIVGGGSVVIDDAFATTGALSARSTGAAVQSAGLTAGGNLALAGTSVRSGAITSTGGSVTVQATAGDAALGATSSAIGTSVTASGMLLVASLGGAGGAALDGGFIDVGTATIGGTLATRSTGAVRLAGGQAGAADLRGRTITLTGDLTSGGFVTVNADEAVQTAALSGGSGITLLGSSVSAGTLTSGAGAVGVMARTGGVTTGAVTAASATLSAASALQTGAIATGGDTVLRGSSVAAGRMTVGGLLDVGASGEIAFAGGTAGQAIVAGGSISVTGDFATTTSLALTSPGAVQTAALTGGTGIAIDGGLVAAGPLTSPTGAISAVARSGALSAGATDAATSATLTARDALSVATLRTGQDAVLRGASVTAGNAAVGELLDVGASGAISLAGGTAGQATVDGGSITIGDSLSATRTLALTSPGAVQTAALTGGTGIAINGGTVTTGPLASSTGAISAVARSGALSAGATDAGTSATLTARDALSVATLRTGQDAVLRGASVTAGNAAVGGLVDVGASGAISLAGGTAGQATVNGGSITIGDSLSTTRTLALTSPGAVQTAALTGGTGIAIDGGMVAAGPLASSTGAISAVARSGVLSAGATDAGTSATLTARDALTVATLRTGQDAILRGASATLGTMTIGGLLDLAAGGTVRLAGGTTGSGVVSGTDVTLAGDLSALRTLSVTGTGAVDARDLAGNDGLTVRGATIAATALRSDAGGVTADATAGSASVGTVAAATTATLSARDAVTVSALESTSAAVTGGSATLTTVALAGTLDVRTSGAARIGGGRAGSLTAEAGSLQFDAPFETTGGLTARTAGALIANRLVAGGATDLSAGSLAIDALDGGGAVTLAATTDLSVTTLSSEGGAATAGGALSIGTLTTAGDFTVTGATIAVDTLAVGGRFGATTGDGGTTTLGGGTAGTLAVTTGAARIVRALSTTGALSITGRSTLVADTLTAGGALTLAGGTITANAVRGDTVGLTGGVDIGEVAAVRSVTTGTTADPIAIRLLIAGDSATVRGRTVRLDRVAIGGALDVATTGSLAIGGGDAGSVSLVSPAITLSGELRTTGLFEVSTDGDLVLGTQRAGNGLRLRAGSIRADLLDGGTGDVQLSSPGGSLTIGTARAGTDVSATTLGTVTIGTIEAGRQVLLSGGRVTAGSIANAGLTAIDGPEIRTGRITSGSLQVDGGNVDLRGETRTATTMDIRAGGSFNAETLVAGSLATLSGDRVDIASARIDGALALTAGDRGAGLGTIRGGGAVSVTSGSGALAIASLSSIGQASVTTRGGVTIGALVAPTATIRGGTADLAAIDIADLLVVETSGETLVRGGRAGDATFLANGIVLPGGFTTTRSLFAQGGAISGTSLTAGGPLQLSGTSVALDAVGAGGEITVSAVAGDARIGRVTAGTSATMDADGTLAVATLTAGGNATLRARDVSLGQAGAQASVVGNLLTIEGRQSITVRGGGQARSAALTSPTIAIPDGFTTTDSLFAGTPGSGGPGTVSGGTLSGGVVTLSNVNATLAGVSARSGLTIDGGAIDIRSVVAGGPVRVAASTLDMGTLAVTGSATLSAQMATIGSAMLSDSLTMTVRDRLSLGGGSAGFASLSAGSIVLPGGFTTDRDFALTGGTIGGTVLAAGRALSIEAGEIALDGVTAGTALSVAATAGPLRLATARAGGAATIVARDGLVLGTLASGTDATVRGAAITIDTAAIGATLDAETAGALTVSGGRAGAARLAGGTIALPGGFGTDGALAATAAGSLSGGAVSGQSVILSGATLTLADTRAVDALTLSATGGDLGVTRAESAATTLAARDGLTVGTLAGADAALRGATVTTAATALTGTLDAAATGALVVGGRAGAARLAGATIALPGGFTTAGAFSATATGTLNGTTLASGGAIALRGASVMLTGLDSAGALDVTADAGGVTLGTVRSATSALLSARDIADVGTLTTGGDATVRGGAITIGASDVGGALDALTAGSLVLRGGRAGSATLAGGTIALPGGFTTDGALAATSGGTLTGTTLTSGGAMTLRGTSVSLASAGAGETLAITTTGAIDLTSGRGESVALSGGPVAVATLVAGRGTLAVRATQTARLGTLNAGGAIDVSSTGALSVGSAGSATSIALTSTDGSVDVTDASTVIRMSQALATPALTPGDGGISVNAGIDANLLGSVSARGALVVNAAGVARFAGQSSGATIDTLSRDLDIGTNGVLGSGTGTGAVRLAALPGVRIFLGGNGSSAVAGSYVATDAEMDRVRAATITVTGGVVGTDAARPADIVVDGLSMARADATGGSFFGPAALFRVETPGTLRVASPASFTNFTATDRAEFIAADRLEVIAPGGRVGLTGADGQAAGTLLFQSRRIVVATDTAAREVERLNTASDRSNRLGQSDGVDDPLGYLRANALTFRVGEVLYVQNSGGTTADNRSGFTVGTGGVTIVPIGGAAPEVIINGRAVDASGTPDQTGRAFVTTIANFAAGSSANGCTSGSQFCGNVIETIALAAPVAQSTNGDSIEGQVDEEERERASFKPRVPALIEVRGFSAPSASPVIDTPVTGAGNDDLWIGATPTVGLSDRQQQP